MTESLSAGDRPLEPMLAAQLEPEREARFRAIYDREFQFVWSAARHFGVPPAARDDVVQDVFLTAYRRLDQVHYQVSERAWLYGVTRRVASHYHRGVARRTRRLAALIDLSPRSGEAPHERHDAARVLERLLARLPRGAREVWEMTELLGMSGPEIAAELELPLNTVYSRLRIARAQLQAHAVDPGLVAAARRDDAPPPEAAARSWAVLCPLLGPGKLVPVAAAGAAARSGVLTTLIVAGAATLAVVAPQRRAAEVAAAHDPEGVSQQTSSRGSAARTPAELAGAPLTPDMPQGSSSPATTAGPDMSPGTASLAAAGLSPDLSPGTDPRAGGAPTHDMSRGTSHPATAPARDLSPATSPLAGPHPPRGSSSALSSHLSPGTSGPSTRSADDLAAEVALLDRARARLDARDAEGAAALLAAHARQFPRGALLDAREAAAVELLCLRGRRRDAEAAARRLTARLPDSVLARRFERFVCPDAATSAATDPGPASP